MLESVQHRETKSIRCLKKSRLFSEIKPTWHNYFKKLRRKRGDLIQTFKILKAIEKVELNAAINLATSLVSSRPA